MKAMRQLGIFGAMLMGIILGTQTMLAAVYSGSCGDNLTWTYDTDTYTLTISGTGPMEEFPILEGSGERNIPWYSYPIQKVIVGEGVTTISEEAFANYKDYYKINSVTLPKSLTSIGRQAFYDCWAISSIQFPSHLESIGDIAFASCTGLSSIDLPASLKYLGYHAFMSCNGIVNIYVHWTSFDGVNIDSTPFERDPAITYLHFPSGGRDLYSNHPYWKYFQLKEEEQSGSCGNGLSWHYNEITKTLTISKTGEGDGRMNDYSNFDKNQPWAQFADEMQHVVVEDGVTYLGTDFLHSNNKVETVSLGKDVSAIANFPSISAGVLPSLTSFTVDPENPVYDSRDNCNALIETATNKLLIGHKVTVIPNTVTTIGKGAFYYCTNLRSINIPDNVVSIDAKAFQFCMGLDTIVIGAGVTSFGEYCFSRTTIKSFTVSPENPKYDSRDNCNALIETATNTLVLGFRNSFIPSSIDSIGEEAWIYYSTRPCIAIPDSLKTIGETAFMYSSGLEEVRIGVGVRIIKAGAFFHSDLKRIFFYSPVPPTFEENTVFAGLSGYTIYVPFGSGEAYKTALPEQAEYIVEADVERTRYYAVLNEQKDTMTLYYDALNTNVEGVREWEAFNSTHGEHVTTVVFDESFNHPNARPISTKAWFKDFADLTDFIHLDYLNTSEVTDMSEMFAGIKASILDLTSFDFSKVTNTAQMFAGDRFLTTIACTEDLSKSDILTQSTSMFDECIAIRGGKGAMWQPTKTDSTYARLDTIGRDGYFSPDTISFIPKSISEEGLYGVYTNWNHTLTLYFDDQCESRNGIRDWAHQRLEAVERVTMDVSVQNARPTTLYRWFCNMPNVREIDLTNLNTSEVKDVSHMFENAQKLQVIYCKEDWSLSETVKQSERMFFECHKLIGSELTHYNRAHTDSAYARLDSKERPGYFSKHPEEPTTEPDDEIYGVTSEDGTVFTLYCDDQKEARGGSEDWFDYSHYTEEKIIIDPSLVKARPDNLDDWFGSFSNVQSIEGLEYIHTSQINSVMGLFFGCSSLAYIDISSFDLSNVTHLNMMFSSCESLKAIDLSNCNINPSILADISTTFDYCTSLERIYCDQDWSGVGVKHMTFTNCSKLKGNVSGLTCPGSSNNDGSFAKVEGGYFSRTTETPVLYAKPSPDGRTLRVRMDNGMESYLGRGNNINHFSSTNGYQIEVVVFDESVSEVNITSMAGWFKDFASLRYIEGLEHLHCDNVTDMSGLFEGCTALETIDLSALNTPALANTDNMFKGCTNLTTIYCTQDWSPSSDHILDSSTDMFLDCAKLEGGNGTAYDQDKTDGTLARCDGEQPGYFSDIRIPYFYVGFYDYDETILQESKVERHTAATQPEEEPFRPDYLFLGWDRSDEELADVTEDMIVNAWYRKNVFTVRFLDWDDTVLSSQKVKRGRDATPPDNPERTGYKFIGWDTEFTNVQKDLDITALYQSTEDLEPLTANPSPVTEKVIRSGCLYILRGDHIYTVTGQEVK